MAHVALVAWALGVPLYDFHSSLPLTATGDHRPIDQQVVVKVFLTLRGYDLDAST